MAFQENPQERSQETRAAAAPARRTGFVFSDVYLRHLSGDTGHPERPERLMAIRSALERDGVLAALVPIAARRVTDDELRLLHTPSYIALVRRELSNLQGLAELSTGDTLASPGTQRALYVLTAASLVVAFLLSRWLVRSKTGLVLQAIRDNERRLEFLGYNTASFKIFVFAVAAALAGLSGLLYAPQVGIITPSQVGVLPSLEIVIWVAFGGRGTLWGALLGAIAVNWLRSVLTATYPSLWPIILGGLFAGVILLAPEGLMGLARRCRALVPRRRALAPVTASPVEERTV